MLSALVRKSITTLSQGATMDVDEEDDPVPEINKRHFEESMKFARRQRKILFMFSSILKGEFTFFYSPIGCPPIREVKLDHC